MAVGGLVGALVLLGPPGVVAGIFVWLNVSWRRWMEDPQRQPEHHMSVVRDALIETTIPVFDKLRRRIFRFEIQSIIGPLQDAARASDDDLADEILRADREVADTAREEFLGAANADTLDVLGAGLQKVATRLKAVKALVRRRKRTRLLRVASFGLLVLGGSSWLLDSGGFPWSFGRGFEGWKPFLLPMAVSSGVGLLVSLGLWFYDIQSPLPENILMEDPT